MILILIKDMFQQYSIVKERNKFMVKEISEIIFDKDINGLIYKKSKELYHGNRISGIVSKSLGWASRNEAKDNTLELLLKENEGLDADAYEIVSSYISDCWQDYHAVHIDPEAKPYRATIGVIFYSIKD